MKTIINLITKTKKGHSFLFVDGQKFMAFENSSFRVTCENLELSALDILAAKNNGVKQTDHLSVSFLRAPSGAAHTVEVNAELLDWIALAMADQDIRYYLCGLAVDCSNNIAIATDGHRLHAHAIEGENIRAFDHNQARIFSRDAVLLALKLAKESRSEKIVLSSDDNRGSISAAGWRIESNLIDGKFPDCKRVMPDYSSRPEFILGRFDKKQLAEFKKITKIFRYRHFSGVCVDEKLKFITWENDEKTGSVIGDTEKAAHHTEHLPNPFGNLGVRVNPEYMIDATANNQIQVVQSSGPNDPVLFTGLDCLAIVMTMRV